MQQISIDAVDTPSGQELLQKADAVMAYDAATGFYEQLSEAYSMATGRREGTGPAEIQYVDILLDADSTEQRERAKLATDRARSPKPR